MGGERILGVINKVRNEDKADTAELMFGVVTAINPLKIKVDNRYEITEDFLILSAMCKEMTILLPAHAHEVNTTVNDAGAHTHVIPAGTTEATQCTALHTHPISAAVTASSGIHAHAASSSSAGALTAITLWRGLQVNDNVRMLRVNKGQTFYVIEREEGIVE